MGDVKEILVFSRMHITNYGDPIIGDCCKYLLEKTAAEQNICVKVSIADVYEKKMETIKKQLKGKQAVVFPGGGMNSIVFNNRLLDIYSLIEQQGDTEVYFNAVGINRISPKPQNEKLLEKLFQKPQTAQVTTRGDFGQMMLYLKKRMKYPPRLVLDPAVWAGEVYGIQRKPKVRKIGIGVIRPEIFEANGNQFSPEDVKGMYKRIILELQKRGYEWELFTNGMAQDELFGMEILNDMGLDKKRYKKRCVKSGRQLVKRIAGYRGVIASRLHANILATSLRVPSIGLVWNDKMNLFADAIDARERYLSGKQLLDASDIVNRFVCAEEEGYCEPQIDAMKMATEETIRNILL
jgi:Uncharacterized conserved protein